MINSKEDLKRYMEMDRIALGIERNHPKMIGDLNWKFEIVLRKHEYYNNCATYPWQYVLKEFYRFRHYYLGLKLGFEIPCNVCGGVLGSTIRDSLLSIVKHKSANGAIFTRVLILEQI